MKFYHENRIYRCPCSFTCESMRVLDKHILHYHVPGLLYECDFCYKVYKSMAALHTHIKNHKDKIKLCYIPACTYSASNDFDLTVHMMRVHRHRFKYHPSQKLCSLYTQLKEQQELIRQLEELLYNK